MGILLICFLSEHRDDLYTFTKIAYFTECNRYIIAHQAPLNDLIRLAKKRSV